MIKDVCKGNPSKLRPAPPADAAPRICALPDVLIIISTKVVMQDYSTLYISNQ